MLGLRRSSALALLFLTLGVYAQDMGTDTSGDEDTGSTDDGSGGTTDDGFDDGSGMSMAPSPSGSPVAATSAPGSAVSGAPAVNSTTPASANGTVDGTPEGNPNWNKTYFIVPNRNKDGYCESCFDLHSQQTGAARCSCDGGLRLAHGGEVAARLQPTFPESRLRRTDLATSFSSLSQTSQTRTVLTHTVGVNGLANVAAWIPVPDPADIVLVNTNLTAFGPNKVVSSNSELDMITGLDMVAPPFQLGGGVVVDGVQPHSLHLNIISVCYRRS